MDETTFRILDALSREFGGRFSINGLTARIAELHKTAYYKNVYDKIKELELQKIISLKGLGKSSIVSLRFDSYQLADLLSEIELKRKRAFLEKRTEAQAIIMEIEDFAIQRPMPIASIAIIDAEKNIKLNRMELLFLIQAPLMARGPIDGKGKGEPFLAGKSQEEKLEIYSFLKELGKKHNMKIEGLILAHKDFFELLSSDELNPLQEIFSNKIVFFEPHTFWARLLSELRKGTLLKTNTGKKTGFQKIENEGMEYNLARLGYTEMGAKIEESQKICIETVIASILSEGSARRTEAIPVILAKASKLTARKPNYGLLLFSCQKIGKLEKLYGLLSALNKIKPTNEISQAIEMLEKTGLKEEKADFKSIKKKMVLYNAI